MPVCKCGHAMAYHKWNGEKLSCPRGVPDLQTQLESLLDCVWHAEDVAMTEDRIDTAIKYGR